ncbi:MAG: hypothetical protein P4M12_00940 [Gammaproteobacteria bacterium]|nr:hypothetical protein [Gammaproteobacteria bacterium]
MKPSISQIQSEIQSLELAFKGNLSREQKLDLLYQSSFCPFFDKKNTSIYQTLYKYYMSTCKELYKRKREQFLHARNTHAYKKEVQANTFEELNKSINCGDLNAVNKLQEELNESAKRKLNTIPEDAITITQEEIKNAMQAEMIERPSSFSKIISSAKEYFDRYQSLAESINISNSEKTDLGIDKISLTLNHCVSFFEENKKATYMQELDSIATHIKALAQCVNVDDATLALAKLGEFLKENYPAFNSKKWNMIEYLSLKYSISVKDIKTTLKSKISINPATIGPVVTLASIAAQEIQAEIACKPDSCTSEQIHYTTNVLCQGAKFLNELLGSPSKDQIDRAITDPRFPGAITFIKNQLSPNRYARKIYNEATHDIKKICDSEAAKLCGVGLGDQLQKLSNDYFSELPTREKMLAFKQQTNKYVAEAEGTLNTSSSWLPALKKIGWVFGALLTGVGFIIGAAVEIHSLVTKNESRFFKSKEARTASRAKRIAESLPIQPEENEKIKP